MILTNTGSDVARDLVLTLECDGEDRSYWLAGSRHATLAPRASVEVFVSSEVGPSEVDLMIRWVDDTGPNHHFLRFDRFR